MIPRVYIDTSVIGGCLDEEFSEWSRRLLEEFVNGTMQPVISDITAGEIERSPMEVRALLQEPPLREAERVAMTEEAVALAERYIEEEVVSETHRVDAQHVAVATICRVDVLVSWNFQHIVKLSRIRAFNAVNLVQGYPQLEIRSPREVCREDE